MDAGKSGGTREECKAYVDDIMSGLLTTKGINIWWDTPLSSVHGETPNEMLSRGFTLVLREVADEYLEQGFT